MNGHLLVKNTNKGGDKCKDGKRLKPLGQWIIKHELLIDQSPLPLLPIPAAVPGW